MMKSIAFIHNSFPAGGAERITIDIARYLHGIGGYDVFVYATRINAGLLESDTEEIIKIRQIPSQAIQSRRAAAVEEFVIKDGIDVLVQVTKSLYGIEGIRQRTGCKTIVACHGEPFWQRHAIVHRRKKGLVRRMMWHFFNKRRFADGTLAMRKAIERTRADYQGCDTYTVLCDSYKAQVEKVLGIEPGDSHIYAIENSERPVENVCWDKENVILFCGRFENWSKRVDRLLRIWSKVQDALPQWKLVLVGDGPDGNMLRKMAKDLNLKRISFEGVQKDVGRYYDMASVVALTSETEGWVLALTEAQARGCIGIAFGCTSGMTEILGPDGVCGFIVPPFDEDKYAEALLGIAGMGEEERMQIRRNSVEKRLRYTPEVIAEKWRTLFDLLTGK